MNFNYIKKDGFFLKLLEAIIDIILVNLGFYFAFLIRFDLNPSLKNIKPFIDIIPYISINTLFVFYINEVFSMLKKSLFDNIFTIIISVIMVDVITVGIVFFNRGFMFPRSVFIIAAIVQFILLISFKIIILKLLKHYRQSKNILIIGSKEDNESIAKRLFLDKYNLDNVRYISDNINNGIYILIDKVDKIYIGSSVDSDTKSNILSYCIGKNKVVYIIPELFEIALINSELLQLDDVPVFKIDNLHLTVEKEVVKRLFDIIVSLFGLIITSPIMLIVAIIIKVYDRGPILFTQERVTKGNKIFKLYKFRSMMVNAEKHTGPVLATEKDPRITPLGRILRMTRLDELPQLFNVIKGDMSIVGPRPERAFFIEQFSKDIPNFKYRVIVKAGVTGLAQVLGKYTTTPEDKLRFDLLYIRNYSFLNDLKIILLTIKVVFLKESSNGVEKDKPLEKILEELNISVFQEIGATRIE